MNEGRYQAWKDTLPQERLERVERVEEMPPQMAIAFVFDELSAEIEEMRRPLWKQVIQPAAVFTAVVLGYLAPDLPRTP